MFVAGTMAEGAPDPLAYLNARLKDWGFMLGPGGQVLGSDGAERDIRYELLEPAAFADRPWHATSHPCPFVGPLAAYLRWEPESWLNHDDFRELALGPAPAGEVAMDRWAGAFHLAIRRPPESYIARRSTSSAVLASSRRCPASSARASRASRGGRSTISNWHCRSFAP